MHEPWVSLRDVVLALAYTVAGISGTCGGCLVAAHYILRGKPLAKLIIAAYAFVGGVFGVAGVAVLYMMGYSDFTLNEILLAGLIFGFFGSLALAGANLSARILVKRLGIEVDISVKRIPKHPGVLEVEIPAEKDRDA